MLAPTLAQSLEYAAARMPSAPALLTARQNWDFAGLWKEARRQAEPLGGTVLPWQLAAGSTDLALAAYACSLAGRPFWPLNPGAVLAAATPPAIPRRSSIGAGLQRPSQNGKRELDDPPPAAIFEKCVPAIAPGTALVITTSGSEGEPKAVMLSAANLDAAATASVARLPLGPGDVWLDCLPLFHIGGLSILWRCAQAGAAVLLHEQFDAQAVIRDLALRQVTHISLVPAMLARLLELNAAPPASLRHVLVGGAALSRPLHERATAAGWPLFPTYGMSETAAQVATFAPATAPWHEGLVGQPLPDNEIAIGADGRIRLRGPQVMLGYANPAGESGLGLEDGWFTTGDLGQIDVQGRLTVLGRADDMLVSGGHNIHPLTVESCLAACPGVSDVAVAGLPDPVWGDRLIALVAGEVSEQNLLAWGREHLPSPARPRQIVRLECLPRNAMGKLDRMALRSCLDSISVEAGL